MLTSVSPLSLVRLAGSPRARAAVRSAILCSSPCRAALNMRVASAKASGGSSDTDLDAGVLAVADVDSITVQFVWNTDWITISAWRLTQYSTRKYIVKHL